MSEGRLPRRACANCDDDRRREYGCTEDTDHQEHWLTLEGGEVVKRCPYALVGERERHAVQCTGLIECGVLPVAGGWLDQAATFCDAAQVVAAARRAFAQEQHKHEQ